MIGEYTYFSSDVVDDEFTLPTIYNNFHLGYQYDKNMQPVGLGLGFTTSTTQEGGNYKVIGYNFGELILSHHTGVQNQETIIKAKDDTNLDLDVRINFKPSDQKNAFTAILTPHNLTAGDVGKIKSFLDTKP
ncbi:hypothetical protein [Wolbachia endosymbiont of Folsomia candida]|uniref:hypothetical protein n=1 Tax=Wolbachia endosymbiont of Folsomia candida TaxID=169402 RepID=UPI000B04DD7F|nr:hypothetical protein [Wolbachia endosymbiont of Folsomia candida]APR98437.1 hypothetical protein ASM33_04115 [Wolbachia endosymbiont of Folsomia candida]